MITAGTALFLLLLVGILGISLGYLLRFLQMTIAKAQLEVNVRKTLNKARSRASKIIAEAYEQTDQLRQSLEDEKTRLNQQEKDINEAKQDLKLQKAKLKTELKKVAEAYQAYQDKLKNVANHHSLSTDQIKHELKTTIDANLNHYYEAKKTDLSKNYEAQLEHLATKHLADVTRRTVRNNTAVTVQVDSSEIGKIIGRDGVNIKAFERYAGVDLVIDDEVNTVSISSFNPKRRLIAKQTLLELLEDGRISRELISEKVVDVESRLGAEATKLLQRGLHQLNLESALLDYPELIKELSELYFRHSYGQNQLEHALETAEIAGKIMLEFDESLIESAQLSGLLHDIGKANPDHDDHVRAGLEIINDKVSPEVYEAIKEHHDPEPSTLLAAVLQTADTLSSARPGARIQSSANYLDRLENLEKVALELPGVDNAYAVSGGKELLIIIKSSDYHQEPLDQLADVITGHLRQAIKGNQPLMLRLVREEQVVKKVA